MLEVLRRMMEEWASLSKICRAEAELYSSCGLNSSAMKSGVNIARTTSWRTAHSDRWTSAVERRELGGGRACCACGAAGGAPLTDFSGGMFCALSRCGNTAGSAGADGGGHAHRERVQAMAAEPEPDA